MSKSRTDAQGREPGALHFPTMPVCLESIAIIQLGDEALSKFYVLLNGCSLFGPGAGKYSLQPTFIIGSTGFGGC
jgi:hypothetical protein